MLQVRKLGEIVQEMVTEVRDKGIRVCYFSGVAWAVPAYLLA